VTSGYGPIVAVRDFSLDVYPGEVVAMLGANGAGKSTTLMTIAGLVRCSSGTVEFDGEDIGHLKPEDIVRKGIVLAPEGRRIFAHLSVTDNLRLGAAICREKEQVSQTMEEMFAGDRWRRESKITAVVNWRVKRNLH
jgi:branched-chain amino acid transport system ATP-binding protein